MIRFIMAVSFVFLMMGFPRKVAAEIKVISRSSRSLATMAHLDKPVDRSNNISRDSLSSGPLSPRMLASTAAAKAPTVEVVAAHAAVAAANVAAAKASAAAQQASRAAAVAVEAAATSVNSAVPSPVSTRSEAHGQSRASSPTSPVLSGRQTAGTNLTAKTLQDQLSAKAVAQQAATTAVAQAVVAQAAAAQAAVRASAIAGVQPPAMQKERSTTATELPSHAYRSRIYTILAGLTFAVVVKALCMASNVLVQISPLPQAFRWQNRGCTGEANPAPYVSIMFGGWQWCYYGVFAYLITKRSGFLILVHSNFLGAAFGTYYTYTFYKNCKDVASVINLERYLNGVVGVVLFQACTLATLPCHRALFVAGLVSSLCSFLGACSMLVSVPIVLQTQNSRPIPGPVVVANFFSGIVWCICGWMLSDPLVMCPNIVAVTSSGICIYLKHVFPSDEGIFAEDDSEAQSKINPGVSIPMPFKAAPPKVRRESETTPLMEVSRSVRVSSTIGRPKAEDEMGKLKSQEFCGTGGTF